MKKLESPDSRSALAFKDQSALEKWLERKHDRSDGLWIGIAKKASGVASVTYDEAVESALCFGWIDGQRRAYDDVYFLQRFTPRRSRSAWSEINRGKVKALIAAGRMRPSGQAAIESAKRDGRWDPADSSDE